MELINNPEKRLQFFLLKAELQDLDKVRAVLLLYSIVEGKSDSYSVSFTEATHYTIVSDACQGVLEGVSSKLGVQLTELGPRLAEEDPEAFRVGRPMRKACGDIASLLRRLDVSIRKHEDTMASMLMGRNLRDMVERCCHKS